MNKPPAYFESIRQRATDRWDQLERDPELAGPWHLLFKQVQSPRHVVSELLQNADDAGASEASITFDDRAFVFEHNGGDFTEEHFGSLCRFGYSNKRALHTIGFRGIGFKSTFSLGDEIELATPSLSVRFHRRRFTEPEWSQTWPDTQGRTRIRVEVQDEHREGELKKNLEEWLLSPVSLLFFRTLRRIRIGDSDVRWGSRGSGPVPDSEWMALHDSDKLFLLMRSEPQPFPELALAEIRQERMLGSLEDSDFPPCKVEVVLGARGRLYVVLPTGVETSLPFACNGPFIQDPARLKIKDPGTSPTNRWLLDRVGKLAASGMLCWLNQTHRTIAQRALAYHLLPDTVRDEHSLEGACEAIVKDAFSGVLVEKSILLTEDGELAPEQRAVVVPRTLLDVWPEGRAAALLDAKGRPALCRNVEDAHRTKLLRWGLVSEISKLAILTTLRTTNPPRPETWHQLLVLWTYLAPDIIGYSNIGGTGDLRIVPVQGKDVLYAANEVVRIGEKWHRNSGSDWEFLAGFLTVLSQDWLRFLAQQRRDPSDQGGSSSADLAYTVLERMRLHDTSDVNKVVSRVTTEFFSRSDVPLEACVRLAQIAAKLKANVGRDVKYVTKDNRLRSTREPILFDKDGRLEELMPPGQRGVRLLHSDYLSFIACSRDEWLTWVHSGKSGLTTIPPIQEVRVNLHSDSSFERSLRQTTGYGGTILFPYASGRSHPSQRYFLIDQDFEPTLVAYWHSLSAETEVWTTLLTLLLEANRDLWKDCAGVRGQQTRTDGQSTADIRLEAPVPAAWIRRLSVVPCLPDTRGALSRPDELFCRTPETEPLMGVEPFVHSRFDTESNRQLLGLLGVRRTPNGPERLLESLRSLARTQLPSVHEVEKSYRRLDQMLSSCSTPDAAMITQAFKTEKIILAHDGTWASAPAVFRSSDEDDAPGAAIVRPSVAELTLWQRVGVAERPTADLAIAWLKGLARGTAIPAVEVSRVRAMLGRHPVRIWNECEHWLNLAGEWVSVQTLAYCVSMQSLFAYKNLHEWVKERTADFRTVSGALLGVSPLSELTPLAGQIEERFQVPPTEATVGVIKEWLRAFGTELARVELDNEEETARVRRVAERLAKSVWVVASPIQVIPYLDGTPAGTPRNTEVVWLGHTLYVGPISQARLARRVPEEIQRAFDRPDVKAALDYAFDRPVQDVRDYLKENFLLAETGSLEDVAGNHNEEGPLGIQASSVSEVDGDPYVEPLATMRLQDQSTSDRGSEDVNCSMVSDAAADDEVLRSASSRRRNLANPRGALDGFDSLGSAETTRDARKPSTRTQSSVPTLPDHQLDDDVDSPVSRRGSPPRPSMMVRFAESRGFRSEGDSRFVHEGGSWIERASGSPFPWEHHAANGELLRCYWDTDHCLELEPLRINAEVWGLIDNYPETYSLVLADIEGNPVELSGPRLRALRDAKVVTLYPASYRLVHEQLQ